MADNLLDKASILLTPTAYDNGSMLSIKPDNGDGDFDFERNSAATRVNAQGLVENVQIISSELVSNGNFSQIGTEEVLNGNFSQEGSELVTNGDFATDSDWTKGNGWSIGDGKANSDGSSGYSFLQQTGVVDNGKVYRLTYSVTNYVSGTIEVGVGGAGNNNIQRNSVGDFVEYHTSNGTNLTMISRSFVGSIDNVSVKEVGQNWNLGSGWSIGEDKIVAVNGDSYGTNQLNVIQINKNYKVTYTIEDYISGTVNLRMHTLNLQTRNSNGTFTEYFTSVGDHLYIQGGNNFNGSITNISVKEVGQDWTLGTGWSVDQANGQLVRESAVSGSYTQTSYDLGVIGNKYSITIDVAEVTSGVLYVYGGLGGTPAINITSSGVYTINHIWASDQPLGIFCNNSFVGKVNSISVKEITDDTNIPRINYEGFSYQDSLGSELVVNGDFSNGSANWSLSGSNISIANGKGISTGSNFGAQFKQTILQTNKTYKLTFDIVDYTSGSIGLTANYYGEQNVFSSIGTHTATFTSLNQTELRIYSENFVGSIDNVSVKEVTGQEVVPDSGCGSWLLEPQSTNLITYSEDFSDSSWTKSGVTLTSSQVSPSGDSTAYKLDFSANNDYIQASVSGLNTSEEYTLSFYAKVQSGSTTIESGNINGGVYETFTVTDQWQRFEVTQTPSSTERFPRPIRSNGIDEIYLWGAQLEQQSYATSYIPTSGATNTRLQDIANNSGNSSLINSTEGVLYAEIAAFVNSGATRYLGLNDGSSSNRVVILYDGTLNRIRAIVSSGGTKYADLYYSVTDVTDFHKVAVKYKANDFALWIDGVERVTETSGSAPIGLNDLDFELSGSPFYGKTKAVAIYKEALTDAELQSLTTI